MENKTFEAKVDSITKFTETQKQEIKYLAKLLSELAEQGHCVSLETHSTLTNCFLQISSLRDNVMQRLILSAKRGNDI